MARGGPAGPAAPPPQTNRHQHRTEPRSRTPEPGLGGGLPVRRHHRRAADQVVSIVDDHTRECLGGLVERSIAADNSSTNLIASPPTRGYPAVLRCDNGPDLACAAMADWAGERVGLAFIPPGEPWRNGCVESFNSRVRDECLDINIFWSLAQARVVISDWKEDYNHRRRRARLPGTSRLRCRLHPPMSLEDADLLEFDDDPHRFAQLDDIARSNG